MKTAKFTGVVRKNYKDLIPEIIDPNTIYLFCNDDGSPRRIFFLCPCGCNDKCNIRARPPREPEPSWDVKVEEDGTPTLHPSVNYTFGCKSHFSIAFGNIAWH